MNEAIRIANGGSMEGMTKDSPYPQTWDQQGDQRDHQPASKPATKRGHPAIVHRSGEGKFKQPPALKEKEPAVAKRPGVKRSK